MIDLRGSWKIYLGQTNISRKVNNLHRVLFLGYIYPEDKFIPRAKFIFIPGNFLARELNIARGIFIKHAG